MLIQRYVFPETIAACLKALETFSGKARIIAGGTDLVLSIKRGECDPVALLDITGIAELEGIEEAQGEVRLGARVTHGVCAASPLIRQGAACLAEACASVASPQVRHVATVVGNVVNAQPAADGAIALVALGAKAMILSNRGAREELVENLYEGPGLSRVDSSRELIAYLRFLSAKAGEGSAYLRIASRNTIGLPVLNGAVWLSLSEQRIENIRIALGPVSGRPFRSRGAETVLKGAPWDNSEVLEEAGRMASEESNPRDSLLRGSAAYRREQIGTLMKGLLKTAIGRARGAISR